MKQKQERTFLEKSTAFGRVTFALLLNTLVCEILPSPSFSLNCIFTAVLSLPSLSCCVPFLGTLGHCMPCLFSVVSLNCLASLTTKPLVVLSHFFLLPICLLSLCLMVLLLSPVVPLGCLSVSLMSFNFKLIWLNLNSLSFTGNHFPFMMFSVIITIHNLNHACYLGTFSYPAHLESHIIYYYYYLFV